MGNFSHIRSCATGTRRVRNGVAIRQRVPVPLQIVPHVVRRALTVLHRHHDGGASERAVARREDLRVRGPHRIPLRAHPVRLHHLRPVELLADAALTHRGDHRAAENLVLAPFNRYRTTAPVVVGLAEPGLHALERELVAARGHCHLLRVVEELDVLLDRMVELDLAGRNLARAPAVDDLDVLAPGQAFRHPAGIHRDVPAADHHHRLRHLGAFARVHAAQEPHSVDDPLVVFSRNPHRLAPPRADGEQHRVVALLELGEAHVARRARCRGAPRAPGNAASAAPRPRR